MKFVVTASVAGVVGVIPMLRYICLPLFWLLLVDMAVAVVVVVAVAAVLEQMTAALSGGGITSKVDVTYLNFFLKEFNAVSRSECAL